MPRWAREPDTDLRIKLAIASFENGHYKSQEDAAKSHGVNPNALTVFTSQRTAPVNVRLSSLSTKKLIIQ